jgi:predicted enzyme related to lactoylglutathione lyase
MSERDGYAPGVQCWVDTWQDDADAAAAFYTQLFGWEAARGEYTLFQKNGRDVAGLGAPSQSRYPAWTTYVWVADADAAAAQARDAGGEVLKQPFDSLDGGRMAVLADPAGALFAVWAPGEHRGARLVNEPSAWAMSLLSSPDPEAAKSFYGAVLDWTSDSFGDFTLFRLEGFVGGEPTQPVPRDVVAAMVPGENAGWTPDFWVSETDATAARAEALGGTVIMPPTDSPVGRTAVVADPTGAPFSISTVARR